MIKIFVIFREDKDESEIIAAYESYNDAVAARWRFNLVGDGYTMIIEIPLYESSTKENETKINT